MIVAPDARSLLIRWCQQHPDINVPGGVRRRLPEQHKTWPAVLVHRIGGGERHGTMHWIHEALLQVDVRGVNDVAAGNLARTLYAAIGAEFRGAVTTSVGSAVVSDVRLGGLHEGWDPDSNVGEIALVRFDVHLTLHPTQSA